MRKVFFWTHLCAGVLAGIVILSMSVTGVLLGFERQIIAWADKSANRPVTVTNQQPLGLEKLLSGIAAPPSAVALHNNRSEAVEVSVGRERTIFLDPYTGAVLGEGSKAVREFFAGVVAWHRWFAVTGQTRNMARAVTGACNLIFLLLVLSGPILWFPPKWRWPNIRQGLLFRSGLSGKARDWNWHNVAGIWSFIPLVLIVASGVVMSYPWANDLLYRLTGTEAPPRQGRPPERAGERRGARPAEWSGLDPLLDRARRQSPVWRSMVIRPAPDGKMAFTIDEGDGGQPQKRGQLLLDRRTGSVVRWEPFMSNNAGRRLRLWSRFVHTGEAGGWIGQVIATASSAAAALLVWTGFALSWRRLQAWRARRKRSLATEPGISLPA